MKSTDWISVKKALPKTLEKVLVHNPYHYGFDVTYMYEDADGKKKWQGCPKVTDKITHWMPIVSPPKEEYRYDYTGNV